MTNRTESYPPDEPVIGATYPPRVRVEPPPYQEPTYPHTGYDDDGQDWDEDEYAYEETYADDEYGYGDPYYDDEQPARQPMFYVFIGLAIVLGVAFVALLFALFRDSGDGDGGPGPTQPASPRFAIQVQSPLPNARLETGKDIDVLAQATSTEEIRQFELLVNSRAVDRVAISQTPADRIYTATLKVRFDTKGDYQLRVRVTTASGATSESDPVAVTAIEPVGAGPISLKGRVLTQVTMKAAPGDEAPSLGTLNSGTEVTVIGRSRDNGWVQIDRDGGRWVRRTAIETDGSLEVLPIRDATPTPSPSPSVTPSVTASPSVSPTVPPTAPDLSPTTALLIDGGTRLRVTIANLSTNRYQGALEVSVGGVLAGTLAQVFDVNINANGATTVDFDLNPAVTTERSAQVRVDPANAIRELNEDNNSVTVRLTPPVEQPDLVITNISVSGNTVSVSVGNNGGPLPQSTVKVRVVVGQNAAEQAKTIALAKDNPPVVFQVLKPGSGEGRVEVIVNEVPVASATHTFP